MNDCREVRQSLGIYVLGAIHAEERTQVNEHLIACPACRDELAELAGLPALLRRVSPDEIDAPDSAPPGLLDQILARVSRNRRRQRRLRACLAAAAVAAVIAALLGGGRLWLNPGGDEFPLAAKPSISANDPRTHVRGSIGLADRDWGTAVTVQLSGISPHTSCRLIAVDRSGHHEVAANWRADYEGRATVTGATAIARGNLARLEVITSTGQALLSISVR